MSDITRLRALVNLYLPPEAGVEAHAILDRLEQAELEGRKREGVRSSNAHPTTAGEECSRSLGSTSGNRDAEPCTAV